MNLSDYVIVVTIVAMIYAVVVREIQNRMIDRKESEEIQKESKRLSEAYKEAIKKGNKKEADKLMEEQVQLLSRMNKMMIGQLKPMVIIMIVFFALTWAIGVFNPVITDDITISLLDNGKGCDKSANDGIYSACYNITDGIHGKWVATFTAYNGGVEVAKNSTFFYYKNKTADTYLEQPHGVLSVMVDKTIYEESESVILMAIPENKVDEIKVTLDRGTNFKVELPFSIPLIFFEIKNFYHPTSWFIFVSLIFSLSLSFITGRFKK